MKTYEEMAGSVIKRIREYELKKEKQQKKICMLTCGIAIVVILSATVINIVIPSYARGLPVIGNVFAYIQDNLDFAGNYSDHVYKLGDTVVSNGTSVTLSEVYCDGMNLYVSYVIESDRFQQINGKNGYSDTQLEYYESSYAYDDTEMISLPDFGIRGLEGKFIDEKTFVGAETYSLSDKSFPESFNLCITIDSFNMIGHEDKKITGKWSFDLVVKTDHSSIVTYEINEANQGHSIDKVIVSPIMITVFTSYPDIYGKSVRYHVGSFSDISPQDEVAANGEYGNTSGITRIPRARVGKEIYIYVYDSATLDTESGRPYRERIEDKSIVKTIISLQ